MGHPKGIASSRADHKTGVCHICHWVCAWAFQQLLTPVSFWHVQTAVSAAYRSWRKRYWHFSDGRWWWWWDKKIGLWSRRIKTGRKKFATKNGYLGMRVKTTVDIHCSVYWFLFLSPIRGKWPRNECFYGDVQTLLTAIEEITSSHRPLKRNEDSQFKAFVCFGLKWVSVLT